MKKIFSIITLSLILCIIVNAEIITLRNCEKTYVTAELNTTQIDTHQSFVTNLIIIFRLVWIKDVFWLYKYNEMSHQYIKMSNMD